MRKNLFLLLYSTIMGNEAKQIFLFFFHLNSDSVVITIVNSLRQRHTTNVVCLVFGSFFIISVEHFSLSLCSSQKRDEVGFSFSIFISMFILFHNDSKQIQFILLGHKVYAIIYIIQHIMEKLWIKLSNTF